jgi:Arc-like DNA binding domain
LSGKNIRFDTPKRFHYGSVMADYTLKGIPEALRAKLQNEADRSFRSINQEILFRLERSFQADETKLTAVHARWVHEALSSGDAKPLSDSQLDTAFDRGSKRARDRKAATK